MFNFIKRWREKRRERKDNLRFLKCPSCGKKFWGHLPTAKCVVAFHAHCPKCDSIVDEENITSTRRAVLARWGHAAAKAAWNGMLFPVRPFQAHGEIVFLETRLNKDLAKIDAKIEQQIQNVKEFAGMATGLCNAVYSGSITEIKWLAPNPVAIPQGGESVIIPFSRHGERLHGQIVGDRKFVDTVLLQNGCSHAELFKYRGSKTNNEALFYGDMQLVSDYNVVIARAIHLRVTGKISRNNALEIINKGIIEVEVQCERVLVLPLATLLSGDNVIPHLCELFIPGGRSFRMNLYFPGWLELGQDVKFQVIIQGTELRPTGRI